MPKVVPRSEGELKLIRKSGNIAAHALKKVLASVKPGISLIELDLIGEKEIIQLGGQPSFKSIPGYFWATCLTVNEEIVHGTPRDIKLAVGDILGVDLGVVYPPIGGWHTDTAWSILVGGKGMVSKGQEEKEQFLKVGEKVLWQTISRAVEGNRIGDISSTIQQGIEGAGYCVVRSLAGHGVGRSCHEAPEIPGFGSVGTGLLLKKGMTLAIEIIYTKGKGKIISKEDGWTLASKDKSWGGLFEMSIVVGKDKPEVLTNWRNLNS